MGSRHNSATHPAEADRIYRALLGPVLERGVLWAVLYATILVSLGGTVSWLLG